MEQDRDVPLTVFKPHVQTYGVVYLETGQYELLGHGFLSIIGDELQNESVHYLEVQSVLDGELLLRSRLRLNNKFEKQRGTVIVWSDQEQRYQDLAISFETDKECDIIWRLICQKIGKNYLQLSGREALKLPNENNLPYILEQTKSSKDMVEYNLLHSPPFSQALVDVYNSFKQKKDKMGMGMIGRIFRSIFSNIDHGTVQALFRDPVFQLILDVNKFTRDIDFPQLYSEKVRIKHIVAFNEELTMKIHVIHRLQFYREYMLDFKLEGYLENILVTTEQEFSKDIVLHLIKSKTIDELIKLTYQSAQQQKIFDLDLADQETFQTDNQEAKSLHFGQKKLEFMMEALIISKQIPRQGVRQRLYDKIIASGFLELTTELMDKGLIRALDFLNCLAKMAPVKMVNYLKDKYRQTPANNLHTKLSKKFCTGNEQVQSVILEIVKGLSEGLKVKENLDFFMGTFFASVFGNCREMRAVLIVVSEMQNQIENIEVLFSQAIKSKVFEKLVVFLRNQRQSKKAQLEAIKILKRVLLQNGDSSWSFRKTYLNKLNIQVIKSGYFDYCMTILLKNIRFNNILSSSMLENIKIIRDMKRFTPYHQEIQNNYKNIEGLDKYTAMILKEEQEKEQIENNPFNQDRVMEQEQEREEAYLMQEMAEEVQEEKKKEWKNEELEQLRKLRQEIEDSQEEIEVRNLGRPGKKVKPNEQPQMTIEFNLPFDEAEGEE